MNTSRFATLTTRKSVNFFLLAVGVIQLSVTGYLAASRASEAHATKTPMNVDPRPAAMASIAPLPSYQTSQVVTAAAPIANPMVDPGLVKRQKIIERQSRVQAFKFEQRKLARRAAKKKQLVREEAQRKIDRRIASEERSVRNKKAIYRKNAQNQNVNKASRKRLSLRSQPKHLARQSARHLTKNLPKKIVSRTKQHSAKRNIASKRQQDDSLESVLGHDAIRTSDELIAENDGLIPKDQKSIARELGIRDNDFRQIWRKEQELKKKLRRADASGATGTRRILLADHQAWMREALGEGKYERYMELAR